MFQVAHICTIPIASEAKELLSSKTWLKSTILAVVDGTLHWAHTSHFLNTANDSTVAFLSFDGFQTLPFDCGFPAIIRRLPRCYSTVFHAVFQPFPRAIVQNVLYSAVATNNMMYTIVA